MLDTTITKSSIKILVDAYRQGNPEAGEQLACDLKIWTLQLEDNTEINSLVIFRKVLEGALIRIFSDNKNLKKEQAPKISLMEDILSLPIQQKYPYPIKFLMECLTQKLGFLSNTTKYKQFKETEQPYNTEETDNIIPTFHEAAEFNEIQQSHRSEYFIIQQYFRPCLYGDSDNDIESALEEAIKVMLTKEYKNDAPFNYFKKTLLNKFRENARDALKKENEDTNKENEDTNKVHKSSKNNIIPLESSDKEVKIMLNRILENWDGCYKYYKPTIKLEQTFTHYFDEEAKKRVEIQLESSKQRYKTKMLLMIEAVLEEKKACSERHYHCQNKNYCTNTTCRVLNLCQKVIPYTPKQEDKNKYEIERQAVTTMKEKIIKNYEKKLKLKGVI